MVEILVMKPSANQMCQPTPESVSFAVERHRSGVAAFSVGRLQMHKLAQPALGILVLAVLVATGVLLLSSHGSDRSASIADATLQGIYRHDWTIRIGNDTYGACQGKGGTWSLYLGSDCIDTATNVKFQQVITVLALLAAALTLSLSAVALLRVRRTLGPTT